MKLVNETREVIKQNLKQLSFKVRGTDIADQSHGTHTFLECFKSEQELRPHFLVTDGRYISIYCPTDGLAKFFEFSV